VWGGWPQIGGLRRIVRRRTAAATAVLFFSVLILKEQVFTNGRDYGGFCFTARGALAFETALRWNDHVGYHNLASRRQVLSC
jgi:hypothetical protein